jgi:tRNA (mo5U34)-methyltransferase
MDVTKLLEHAKPFAAKLQETKHRLEPADGFWYPYQSLSNVGILQDLLQGQYADLSALIGDDPVADIGAADGDMSFLLEEMGCDVDLIDWGLTNYNKLQGARRLKEGLGSGINIHEVDLDSQFHLPRKYGLTLFLGILYHLQNPYYILKELARSTRWALMSTRIARVTTDRSTRFDTAPVAYLLGPTECNNDNTNYWIFSPAGIVRILERTGWEMAAGITTGDPVNSDPATAEGDERVFCLLRSTAFRP